MGFNFDRRGKAKTALLITLLAVGGCIYLVYKPSGPAVAPKPTVAKNVVAYSTDKPGEVPVDPSAYISTAGPNEPKYITLPTIGAQGFIQKMGIDQNNQVAAPNNVNLAGWYVNSLSPGQAGLSIIDGHIDGLHGPGIFLRLNKLSAGDTFTIELGNGSNKIFRVKQIVAVADADAAKVLFSRDATVASQLNLITCGGSFDRQSHSYNQRTVVISELVSS
jgi:hypothetical protein